MTRHSKNQNARMFFTAAERQKAGFGSHKERLSAESQVPFGFCCLSLRLPDDPVATPEGFIFDRDVLIEYMGHERERLKRARKSAAQLQSAVTVSAAVSVSKPVASNFWLEASSVKHEPSTSLSVVETQEASNEPILCPMSGKRLRLKNLTSLRFEIAAGSVVICCVSKRPIGHLQAVALKPSGAVMLESVYKEVVEKTGRCPLTSDILKEVLKLQKAGSGFSSSGGVEKRIEFGVKSRAFEGGTRGLRI